VSDQEWKLYSQREERESEEERRRREAAKAARREAEEKARWIAARRAEDRAAARKKLLRTLSVALPLALLLAALALLAYPGYQAYRAADAAERGDLALAAERYRDAASWGVYDRLFHAGARAEELDAAQRLASCTAGVPDREIPRGALRLQGTAQGREGPITVEVIADSQRIYRVAVIEHSETDAIGGEAARQIPGRIFRAQSAEVDAVTGATISSRAICDAVSQALSSDEAWAAGIYPWKFGALPPMPSPSPTPGPTPRDLKVFFYENELEEFTEQVGESVRLRARAYPEGQFTDAVYHWSVSDPTVLKLSVSEDSRECVVLCLSHQPGGVTLTVECNGFTRDIQVYTRR
jgi:uncharacterized protein with FMN-binding domain